MNVSNSSPKKQRKNPLIFCFQRLELPQNVGREVNLQLKCPIITLSKISPLVLSKSIRGEYSESKTTQ